MICRFSKLHRYGCFSLSLSFLSLFLLSGNSFAEEEAVPTAAVPEESLTVSQHEVTIGGQKVAYTASAGTVNLSNEKGEATASIFHIAYTRDTVDSDPSQRPLIFSFNGGPGSASVWLHLGILGPRYIAFPGDGSTLPQPPYQLSDNSYSLLDVADLVFIDPVSTGFSRVEDKGKPSDFHGLNEDIQAVADFIRLYTSRNGRWTSPKYLIGESYGGVRAAGLATHLQDEMGMYLNGILVVSGLFDFSTILAADNNDLPYILFLPSMTATAHYHQKLAPELQNDLSQSLKLSEEFARGDYTKALFQGSAIGDEERNAVSQRLAELTGLSPSYVQQSDLRISPARFMKELLRDQDKIIGRFDSRVTGFDGDTTNSYPGYDPSMASVFGPFSSTINDYLRRELNYVSDLPYQVMASVHPWNYPSNRFVSVADSLANAMRKNPFLKVHVACGYYDMATPYFAILHSINHMDLTPDLRKQFTIDFYQGGHMMYTNPEAVKKLKADFVTFLGVAK